MINITKGKEIVRSINLRQSSNSPCWHLVGKQGQYLNTIFLMSSQIKWDLFTMNRYKSSVICSSVTAREWGESNQIL